MAWLKQLLCTHEFRFRGYMNCGQVAVFRCEKCKKLGKNVKL